MWNELSDSTSFLGTGFTTSVTLSNKLYTIEIRNVKIPITVTKSLYLKVTLNKIRTP